MAWTLTLLLVVSSILLVTYLHHTIQKIRKKAVVYPSEAVIDQLLPPVSLHPDTKNFKLYYCLE